MARPNEDAAAAAMRKDIHEAYERLKAEGQLSGSVKGNDIHAVVAKHIRSGMSVRAAEEVLTHAGFELVPPSAKSIDSGVGHHEIYARSDRILESKAFGITNEVVVTLSPASTAPDAAVSSMTAHIYVTSL